MNVAITDPSTLNGASCGLDQSCADNGCGCTTAKHPASDVDTPRGKTLSRAGIVGLLCVLGCAAGPFAVGGLATVTGALSGEAWIIVAGLLIAAAVYVYRHRTGRCGC